MKKKIFLVVVAGLVAVVASQVRFDIAAAEVEKKYALPDSKFIDIKGLRVHYTDTGKGQVLILLHGTGASLHTWQGWMKALKGNFRVIRLDLPGFGLTGPATDHSYSLDSYVRFLEDFVTALKLKQLYIVGNSLGGHVAWRYTATHGNDVDKLVLIDSAGLPRVGEIPLPIRLARKPVLSTAAKYISPRFMVKRSLKEVYFDPAKVTDELVDRYYTLALRSGNRQAFVDRAQQLVEDDGKALRKVSSPTLILWGRHDKWIPVEQAENFKKNIPWATKVVIFENAGHVPQEEIPDESVAAALKHLQ